MFTMLGFRSHFIDFNNLNHSDGTVKLSEGYYLLGGEARSCACNL